MADPVFETVAIIGIGLIGSSIARACETFGTAKNVVLYDVDADVRTEAADLGLGTIAGTPEAAVSDADLVILCTPVGALGEALSSVSTALKPGAIVTDVGSVKSKAITAMQAHIPEHAHLIPAHPIAGTEKSGPSAGFPTLFANRWFIITPLADVSDAYQAAVAKLEAFWTGFGSMVETMDPERHDLVLAITSHLPHLIAFNIVSTAADMEQVTEGEVVKYSAAGFRDFTRIAASDPIMWRDVFLNNKDAVLETLGRFSEDLTALQRAIRWGDGETLHAVFTRARGIRQSIIEAGQDTSATNFGRDDPAES